MISDLLIRTLVVQVLGCTRENSESMNYEHVDGHSEVLWCSARRQQTTVITSTIVTVAYMEQQLFTKLVQ